MKRVCLCHRTSPSVNGKTTAQCYCYTVSDLICLHVAVY